MDILTFTVYGQPQSKGSKTVGMNRRGQAFVRPDNRKAKPWQQAIEAAAGDAMGKDALITGPVKVTAELHFKRNKGHYGTGKNAHQVKASAPYWHTVKPDADKVARTVGDALEGVVLRNDNQIASWVLRKWYTEGSEKAVIVVETLIHDKNYP